MALSNMNRMMQYQEHLTIDTGCPPGSGNMSAWGGRDVQAKSIRVQVKYKHSWLPAIKKVMKPVEFFITEVAPLEAVIFPHESIENLIVDKLLATNEHTGRERFKDDDLMVLLDTGYERTLVNNKLELIAARQKGMPVNL